MKMQITHYCQTVCRLCAASLCLMLLLNSAPAVAAEVNDEFLTGYVASVLERDLHWERGSYSLKIVNGDVTITLFADDPIQRTAADKQLRAIDGVHDVAIMVQSAGISRQEGTHSKFMGVTGEGKAFPVGDLFQGLIADPKQAQFFATMNKVRFSGEEYTMASVGFGETFGMYRFLGSNEGDGLQLSLVGALFAQFNMTESSDLMNADYTIGIPVTYRYGDNSVRFRIYHQSSHLGDELLESLNPPNQLSLNYEAVEFLYSREWLGLRVYGGGEYLIHKQPDELQPAIAHWGVEYRGSKPLLWTGRPIGGVDMKSLEEHDWDIDTSIKIGLEFGKPNPGQRRLRLLAEYYIGYDPRGQFYSNKVEYYGLGVALGF